MPYSQLTWLAVAHSWPRRKL